MIRALICVGVLPTFFAASLEERKVVFERCREVFGGWKERYGVDVIASLDDDQVQIGPTFTYPWSMYVLCDAPDREAVIRVVNGLREGDPPLFKYMKLEVRMGRPASGLGLPDESWRRRGGSETSEEP
ncbi:MAG: hypothetical protein WD795_04505 [Woeseia sp.]